MESGGSTPVSQDRGCRRGRRGRRMMSLSSGTQLVVVLSENGWGDVSLSRVETLSV
jgi:hypothetical protein